MPDTAIVTGASRGIGREICIALAKRGHRVVAMSRSENQLLQLQSQYPSRIRAYPVDLTDVSEIQKFTSSFFDEFNRVNILVNNAGSLVNKPFEELSKTDWQAMIDTNLLTNVLLTKALLPGFAKQAHIVNISSMGGFQGSAKFRGLSAYSVAKGAVSILTECLAVELADRDIRVNALCLGAVQTDMLAKAFPGFDAPVTAAAIGRYIADFALTGSAFYNGQVLPVTLADPG